MPTTKIMAVIKASGYGSGSHHFYKHLESRKIDYLAVALIDEAVELRIKGCQLPIMIFNPQLSHLDSLWIHNLEPEIFSLSQLKSLITHAQSRPLKIHIKIDSGMHRLGFDRDELSDLIQLLKQHKYLEVTSIFSHLAGSEDVTMDENSLSQIKNFNEAYTILESSLEYSPFKHILNTAGIVRFSEYQFDMVRLGIGLYGIDESKLLGPEKLKPANKLSARIIHINTVRKGQSTGYGNAGIVSKDSTIGIVGIGYADGLMRAAGNGRHNLKIKNRLYPILGNVCMDVCMVDITDSIGIKVGDEVIIFDHDHSIDHLANACNTISYEILSRIAPRVKRIFIH